MDWGIDVHLILVSAPSLKRLTFWIEGECEDACQWARLVFQEFHDKLFRLEQVSCVINGPDMSTSFDVMGCLTRTIELGVIGPRMTFGSSCQCLSFVAGLRRTFAIGKPI